MINISSTTPSTSSCTLHLTTAAPHPQPHHACANSKLISYRRHLPVLHSDPGQAHGHTPAAGPQPAPEGITAPGHSPKARQTRQYEHAKANHERDDRLRPLTSAACVSPTPKRPMYGRENAACGMPFGFVHVTAGDLGLRRTCL
jgi:hypothetical protein